MDIKISGEYMVKEHVLPPFGCSHMSGCACVVGVWNEDCTCLGCLLPPLAASLGLPASVGLPASLPWPSCLPWLPPLDPCLLAPSLIV